jgi:hypothetical protein
MISVAVRLAQQLTLIYKECERWNNIQKHAIAALSNPADNALDVIDKL